MDGEHDFSKGEKGKFYSPDAEFVIPIHDEDERPMEPYGNQSGDSGVQAFELGDDFIEIQFQGQSRRYRYTSLEIGAEDLERMKKLAIAGKGLATFINQNPHISGGFVR